MKRDVLLSMNFTIVRNLHNINFTLQAYSIHYNLQSFTVPGSYFLTKHIQFCSNAQKRQHLEALLLVVPGGFSRHYQMALGMWT